MQLKPRGMGANPGRIATALAALIVIVAYAILAYRFDASLRLNAELRAARLARAAFFSDVIDMETGMRGYAATGRAIFLQPYRAARARWLADWAAAAATARGVDADTSVSRAVDAERALIARWLERVGEPLVAARRRPDALARQLEGKALIDRVRALDATIIAALGERAETADADARRLMVLLAATGLVTMGAIFGFALDADRRQRVAQAERRITETLRSAVVVGDALPAGVGLDACYVAAGRRDLVGGDWYDAFVLPDGAVLIVIGDALGHGIGAVRAMTDARRILLGCALHENDPARVLERANQRLCEADAPLTTAVVAFVDRRAGTLCYASAGHPPPAIAIGGAAMVLPTGGIPLGVDIAAAYDTHTLDGLAGSLAVFYTDGLIEWDHDVVRGEAQMLAALRTLDAGPGAAYALRERVVGRGSTRDDIAIVTVHFPSPVPASAPPLER